MEISEVEKKMMEDFYVTISSNKKVFYPKHFGKSEKLKLLYSAYDYFSSKADDEKCTKIKKIMMEIENE